MSMVFRLGALGAILPLSGQALAATEPRSSYEQLESRVAEQDARISALEARLNSMAATMLPSRDVAQANTSMAEAAPHDASPVDVSDEPGIRLRGRLQVDALTVNDGDGRTPTGTQIRRLYLGVSGQLNDRLRYLADVDFAGDKAVVQDAFVGYAVAKDSEIVLGYTKPAITSDELTSDVYTLFLERSAYSGVFAPGRRVGIAFNHSGTTWGVQTGLYGENGSGSLDGDRSEEFVVSARGYVDLLPGDETLHLAASTYYRDLSPSDGGLSLGQKPEASRALTAIDTGQFAADHAYFIGGEAGFGSGPLTIQAEGGMLDFSGTTNNPKFTGYSAQVGWRLTGEARPYSHMSGIFGRVVPRYSIGQYGWGAFEAGLRISHVDLSDGLVDGGELTTYGAVFNWYPIDHVRISANYIHADIRRLLETDRQDLLAFRGAIDW